MCGLKCSLKEVEPIIKRGDEVKVLISPKTVNSTQLIMGVAKLAAGKKVLSHVHDYSEECFFVLKGTGVLCLNGVKSVKFGPGDAILVPKGVGHSVENIGSNEMEIVFASAPLAPKASVGHRETKTEEE